jgi:2'-5' RNA ligase
VPPPDWHVTLCFLGGVEEALLVALCERAGSVTARAFELQFRCLRHWGQAGVIAALAPAPAPAATLAEALRVRSRELGLTPDEQPLQPHITLVRGLRGKPWQGPRETALELTLAARSFRLVESLEGVQAPAARYRTLEVWPLEC